MIKSAFMWRTVAVGCLAAIVTLSFGRLSYGVVMPFMQKGLALTYVQAGGLGTACSLGYVLIVAFAGPLASRLGSKFVITTGVSVVCAGLISLTFVQSFAFAAVLMIIIGVGTALTYTPMIALLINWFPAYRGLVTGVISSAIGFGTVLTGVSVPFLVTLDPENGWRMTWEAFGLAGLLVAILCIAFLRNPPQSKNPGSVSVSGARSFYFRKDIIFIGLTYFLVGFSNIIPTTYNMAFMLNSGLVKETAGIIIAVGGILSLISGPLWGTLSDRQGRKTILTILLILTATTTIIPAIQPNLLTYTISAIIGGLTISGLFGQVLARVSELVDPIQVPATLSYVTLFFGTGLFISPSLAGWIIQMQGDFRLTYIIAGVVLIPGVLFNQAVPETGEVTPATITGQHLVKE